MKPLDKKQIPQFAALCVLTAGVAGYGVMHFVLPGTASASTQPAAPASGAAAPKTAASAAKAGDAKPGGAQITDAAAGAGGSDDAPPPSPAMRDPFAAGYVDPSTRAAALAAGKTPALPALAAPGKLPVPGKLPAAGKQIAALSPLPVGPAAPALPAGLSTFPSTVFPVPAAAAPASPPASAAPIAPALPAPALPAPPTWTVTGVLQGANGKVAILRSGEARRIVRSGDFVDSTYRVTGVSRTAVVLRHGTLVYHLSLGGPKPGTGPAAPGAAPAALPVLRPFPETRPVPAAEMSSVMPRVSAVFSSALLIPVYHLPHPKLPMAHPARQSAGLTLAAETLSVPKPANLHAVRPAAAKVAKAISLGLRLLDGTVLAPDTKN